MGLVRKWSPRDKRFLNAIAAKFGHKFTMSSHSIGGIAIDEFGTALPDATLAAARNSHAILLGAVGGPKWDNPTAKVRPEQGLLKIRKELGLFANLRPIAVLPELVAASPLKPEIVSGVDILFFRELTGGLYFGESGTRPAKDGSGEESFSTMIYSTGEVERIVRLAAQAARGPQEESHLGRQSQCAGSLAAVATNLRAHHADRIPGCAVRKHSRRCRGHVPHFQAAEFRCRRHGKYVRRHSD